jgi:hypothetical protein
MLSRGDRQCRLAVAWCLQSTGTGEPIDMGNSVLSACCTMYVKEGQLFSVAPGSGGLSGGVIAGEHCRHEWQDFAELILLLPAVA